MNVFQALHNMSPTTEFLERPVDERMIGLILHSATRSLSAGNMQEWEFIVVEDEKTKERLGKSALNLKHVMEAPTLIVVCVDLNKASLKYGKRGEIVYAVEDGAAATQTLIIAATALGLGYDLVRAFDEEEVRGIVGLPDNIRPISIVPLGFPAHELKQENRINFENITHVDRYGNKIAVKFEPVLGALEKILLQMRETYKAEDLRKGMNAKDFLKTMKKILKK
jgi:nitroreductase